MKVTGKKAEESALQSYRGGGGQGTMVSALLQPRCSWPGARKLSCWGQCPCGLICSVSPLSSHRSLHVAGALMTFKCLTHAHTILVGLVLSWKEDKGETLTPSGSSYWGAVSSGAFGTHPRVILARVPQLLPQHLPVRRGSLWKRSEEEGEETPSSPYRPPKMSWSRRGWKRIPRHEIEWKGNKVY